MSEPVAIVGTVVAAASAVLASGALSLSATVRTVLTVIVIVGGVVVTRSQVTPSGSVRKRR